MSAEFALGGGTTTSANARSGIVHEKLTTLGGKFEVIYVAGQFLSEVGVR